MANGIATCQYCGAHVAACALQEHEYYCIARPGVRDLVAQFLADETRPGYAVAYSTYSQRRTGTCAPIMRKLCDRYGNYRNVCELFGLKSPGRRSSKSLAPSVAELQRIATEMYGNKCAPSQREYDMYSGGDDALTAKSIVRILGTWIAFCDMAGLPPLDSKAQRLRHLEEVQKGQRGVPNTPLADDERRTEHRTEADERLAEMLSTLGLPVCRVRALPDGRTAYVIR